jgi:hypothetical protein
MKETIWEFFEDSGEKNQQIKKMKKKKIKKFANFFSVLLQGLVYTVKRWFNSNLIRDCVVI